MSAADALAVLRAVAVIPVGWAVLVGEDVFALAMFTIAALTDAFDGFLARRAGGLGARGAFLDPLADKILVVGTLLALTIVGRGWPVTVVTILVALREGAVTILRARLAARGVAFPADQVGKVKTAAEMVGVALIVLGGKPWAVLGAGIVGLAFLASVLTVPRYLGR